MTTEEKARAHLRTQLQREARDLRDRLAIAADQATHARLDARLREVLAELEEMA
jgi:hypothetical protein